MSFNKQLATMLDTNYKLLHSFLPTLIASDIPSLDWSKITSGKPTTLAGYGITDGITSSSLTTTLSGYAVTNGSNVSGTWPINITGNANTVGGYSAASLLASGGGLGSEQNWTDVTGSRAGNVVYTNNTGKPIQLGSIQFSATTPPSGNPMACTTYINGIVMDSYSTTSFGTTTVGINPPNFSGAIIPVGATYQVNWSGYTSVGVTRWIELR